jgi:glucosamine--fructose-6-phosphate aminotransferase (isomerizing)
VSLRDEIFQQADVLQGMLDEQWDRICNIAKEVKKYKAKYIFLAARGTSDNAGLYAKYLFGAHNHIPVALAAPSLFSIYDAPPNLEGALVLAISQSGQSPDIVGVVEGGKKQGVPTMAITNNLRSPLGQTCDYSIDILAGEEEAVAATKTYTAELMAIAMLSAALSGDGSVFEELQRVPKYISLAFELEAAIKRAVEKFYYMEQCVVIGRGFNYATAYEWALKLKELVYVVAEPYSSADFLHGPIAMVENGFPVFLIAPSGEVYPQLLALAKELASAKKANLLVISDEEEILDQCSTPLKLPGNIPEWVSPLVSIVPVQLFCQALAGLKGYDVERPRGLTKVTRTT